MKTIKFLFSDLNQDERQILGGLVIFLSGSIFLIWLISTVKPPVKDHPTFNKQVQIIRKHELPKFYDKYSERVYNDKFGK
jgi:hypothetical protein